MKNQYRKWIGVRLEYFRKIKGYTQEKIAQLLNIKAGTYGTYEQGTAMINIILLSQLCEIYEITLDEFMKDMPQEYKLQHAQPQL